jgi:hypothetical protein
MILVSSDSVVGTFIVILGSILLALGIWERVVRSRAGNWPAIQGTIDKAWVKKSSGKRTRWIARLDYSYSVQNKSYTGRYSQSHRFLEEAEECVRDLSGKAIMVHYSERWPVFSVASDEDVKALSLNRASSPNENPALDQLPPVEISFPRKLIAYAFMVFAIAGFLLSLYVHISSWLGRIVLPDSWFFLMHMGMLIPFFAAIILAPKEQRRKPAANMSQGILFKALKLVFYYAIANFAVFILSLVFGHHQSTELVEWRGFSGHWMLFYFVSFVALYYIVYPTKQPLA